MTDNAVVATTASPHVRVHGVDPRHVILSDSWFAPRKIRAAHDGLLSLLNQFESHGIVERFRELQRPAKGPHFTDSDLYKWVEAAAWAVGSGDAEALLAERLDEVIGLVAAAAEPNGYVHTYWPPEGRYERLWESHDLYCAGHLLQAAVAVHRALGDERLLKTACAFADHICDEFGPQARQQVDGHPEVEMALVELYRETGERRYLDQAQLFLHRSEPGTMQRIAGHAVRVLYYGSGLVDACAEVRDDVLADAEERLWRSLVDQHHYITGAVGGRWIGESVGRPYELPSQSAYAETCASVAVVLWAWRRMGRGGDAAAEAADLLERGLYNAVLAGIGLDGRSYFYSNALSSTAEPEPYPWRYPDDWHARSLVEFHPLRRQEWFPCTCCPPNVHRLLQELPGLVYGVADNAVHVHLHIDSALNTLLPDGRRVRVVQRTKMPFDGIVELELDVDPGAPVALHVRIPSWSDMTLLDGRACGTGGYEIVEIAGSGRVRLELDMTPRFLEAHPHVTDLRDQVAVQRGPLVYCAETLDNPGVDLQAVRVDPRVQVRLRREPLMLGGVTMLELSGSVPEISASLYRRADTAAADTKEAWLRLIPYATWANRGTTGMATWFRRGRDGGI